jgi:hypothetical protein
MSVATPSDTIRQGRFTRRRGAAEENGVGPKPFVGILLSLSPASPREQK